jgi:flagellar biosynthetic protein FliR
VDLHLDLTHVAITAALALRFTVLAATLPFLGHRGVPVLWRVALAVVLATAVAPAVREQLGPQPLTLDWSTVTAEAARSLLVGALLSVATSVPFVAVRYAGQLTGVQIGYAIVNTIDPQSGAQVSVLAQFYYLLGTMIFFAIDAHHTVLAALVQSGTALPLFAPLDGGSGAWLLLQDFGVVFGLGLKLAAPCVIVLLMVSATMGVIVKTVPQMNVLVVGFPLRIAAGLLTLGLSLVFFGETLVNVMQGMGGQFERLLLALR